MTTENLDDQKKVSPIIGYEKCYCCQLWYAGQYKQEA